jgi:hypothetical protein
MEEQEIQSFMMVRDIAAMDPEASDYEETLRSLIEKARAIMALDCPDDPLADAEERRAFVAETERGETNPAAIDDGETTFNRIA